MAVTFQSAGALTSGSDSSAETAAPASVASGDLLLCELFVRSNTHDLPASPPTGWTLSSTQADNSSVYGDIAVYHRIADGGANDTPTFTLAGTPTSGWHTRIIRVTGHDGSAPIDTTAAALRATSTDAEIPVATVARNGSIAFTFGGQVAGGSDSDQTWPSGWTEAYDDWESTTYRSFVTAGYDPVDAGTMSSSQNVSGWTAGTHPIVMVTVVVQPPAAGGASPYYVKYGFV